MSNEDKQVNSTNSIIGKTYTEYNGIKVRDKVFILDHYSIVEVTVLEIYADYYSDGESFICKWVKTDRGTVRLEDVYRIKIQAQYAIQNKKNAYDAYVTRGF